MYKFFIFWSYQLFKLSICQLFMRSIYQFFTWNMGHHVNLSTVQAFNLSILCMRSIYQLFKLLWDQSFTSYSFSVLHHAKSHESDEGNEAGQAGRSILSAKAHEGRAQPVSGGMQIKGFNFNLCWDSFRTGSNQITTEYVSILYRTLFCLCVIRRNVGESIIKLKIL